MLFVKAALLAIAGATGGILTQLLGGFDHLIKALIMFMVIDFISGWLAVTLFKKSEKADPERPPKTTRLQGIIKKACMLLMVIVAVHLDGLLGTNSLTRDALIIAFSTNELLSILENMGDMGIKMPEVLANALEILGKRKND
ncbi:MAG: phage holin family protein [Defluviitaleaceae bacterium]|nr:phage holin family protein [Defluviitaleaceae bacterium]